MKRIYLDYAAATPLDPRVLKVMEPYFSRSFANPSAVYLSGRQARQALEVARQRMAAQLGARPTEIILTSGATEANNLAIQGVMRRFPVAKVLVSAIEHESVLVPAALFKSSKIPVDKFGRVNSAKLAELIDDQTVLISVGLVNNEIGALAPLREISQLVKQILKQRSRRAVRLPLYLHTDAAQAASFFDLQVARLGVDFMSINGGKIYGPKQSGLLYVRSGTELQPLILGGGQELGRRSGTENLPAVVGLAEALDLAQAYRTDEVERLQILRQDFIASLQKLALSVIINGSPQRHAPHIVHASFPGHDGERLMMQLDGAGVEVALGSACSAASTEPSHVLRAIGLSDELARSSLRFSFGRPTTATDLVKSLSILAKILQGVIS